MLPVNSSDVYKPTNAESAKIITPKNSLGDTKRKLPDDKGYFPDKRLV